MRLMHAGDAPAPKERGAAIAELAMVIPLMLLLLVVLYDFGRGYFAYITVTNAARDVARVAMQENKDCSEPDLALTATNSAAPYAVTLQATPLAEGMCEVTITHTYVPILPFVTGSFSLPVVGQIGPLWDGAMSETMYSL